MFDGPPTRLPSKTKLRDEAGTTKEKNGGIAHVYRRGWSSDRAESSSKPRHYVDMRELHCGSFSSAEVVPDSNRAFGHGFACEAFCEVTKKLWTPREISWPHESPWTGPCHRWAVCITSTVLILMLLNEHIVLARTREERHAVIKGIHGDAIPWARGRQSDPGVGRYWRRCHASFLKEVQVRPSINSCQ